MTNNKTNISFIAISIIVAIIIVTEFLVSFYFYDSRQIRNIYLSNDMISEYLNEGSLALYMNGNEISSMNVVPRYYAINTTTSYCYLTNHHTPDNNTTIYTNSNQEHVIGGFSKGEKCVVYFENTLKYWYKATSSSNTYSFGSYDGTLYDTGDETGSDVYIGQSPTEYYVCQKFSGKEVCFDQDYHKYGLENHTKGSNLDETTGNAAAAGLKVYFDEAGITGHTCNRASTTSARCYIGNKRCGVHKDGYLFCINDNTSHKCYILYNGNAYCI